MKTKFLLFLMMLFSAGFIKAQTVYDIVQNSANHNTLEVAIDAASLDGVLDNPSIISTLFAPTDAAFAALPAGTVEALLADPSGALTQILLYHAVNGEALSTDLSNGLFVKTLNGKSVSVKINASGVFINNAKVTVADVQADNGVVHVIDAVLLPPSSIADVLINSPIHSTLVAAASAANLVPALQDENAELTLFAPTDAAFAALPAGTVEALLADPSGALTQILLYHAVNGEELSTDLSNGQTIATLNGKNITVSINSDGVFINNAKVTVADVQADNGVVHVIDAVLLPPTSTIDVEESSVIIYPNPMSDVLNIILPSDVKGLMSLKFFDNTGRLVLQTSTSDGQLVNPNLSNGFYSVEIINDNITYTGKVVKK